MMRLRASLSILFLAMTLFSPRADDGTWSQTFSILGGNIYSETENPDISLEKELLVFDGERTRAWFFLKNTADRQVTVECGFPVRHELDCEDAGDMIRIRKQRYTEEDMLPSMRFFQTRRFYDPGNEDDAEAYGDYYPYAILKNEHNNGREFIDAKAVNPELSFVMEQDGHPVTIVKVLVERHAGDDGVSITYHLCHDLVFAPGGESTVSVEYVQALQTGDDGGFHQRYGWTYVIGTGATWKGPIGSFLFVKPATWNGDPKGLVKAWENECVAVYSAVNYEPGREDRFYLDAEFSLEYDQYRFMDEEFPRLKKMWSTKTPTVKPPSSPAQDYVRSVSASSFLPDKINVFTEHGVMLNAGFGPLSAFDGVDETAWCEKDPKDGLGEYLECEITRPAWGLVIHNGFSRFFSGDWMFQRDTFESGIRDDALGLKDYFSMNNRVRELAISTPGGATLYTLVLEDRRDPRCYPGIYLKPGKYRFTIRNVFPGSKWKDTCIGEIRFLAAGNPGLEAYWEDPFFRKYLPKNTL
ncbi:MAG TPA: hypothetical protein VMX33_14850 [bacterium]|nr:hypothetical protein [bacterium]